MHHNAQTQLYLGPSIANPSDHHQGLQDGQTLADAAEDQQRPTQLSVL
jgi:hypothetical protein